MTQFHQPSLGVRLTAGTIQGRRDLNADAHAHSYIPDVFAVAIADGAGDYPDSADCAATAATTAAALAAATANPRQALTYAAEIVDDRNLRAAAGRRPDHPGDGTRDVFTTTTVLAITPSQLRLAWVGDSPAWAITHTEHVVGLTSPSCHPGMRPCNLPGLHHTPGLGHTSPDHQIPHHLDVDRADIARVVLATDGLTAHLNRDERRNHVNALSWLIGSLAQPAYPADHALRQLLDLATSKGASDNTTVAIIDLG